jgi:hypothetical protein
VREVDEWFHSWEMMQRSLIHVRYADLIDDRQTSLSNSQSPAFRWNVEVSLHPISRCRERSKHRHNLAGCLNALIPLSVCDNRIEYLSSFLRLNRLVGI